jgi:predicted RecA/RadA family phage recombinase
METYRGPGRVLELTAPTGGVVSGTAYLIGSLVVIALKSVAQTLKFPGLVKGIVDLPKVVEEGWSEGLKLYWDDSEGKVTATSEGNTLIGVAVPPIVPFTVVITSDALAADLAIDGLSIQVLDYATLASGAPVITVSINGVETELVEGTDWTAETSDEVTASNIATAIGALTGVEASAVGDTVTVVAATGVAAGSSATGRVRLDGVVRA